ncbi:protein I'm not dead yet-like [Bicyclus anynana]|uniref:Protein I'm not dead yet-like n=1 Tax=Bicyclus anynana TaxID=110368 RepID=A0ABM3LMT7_BICAN|nr:protein I'm not dead yet-like [Bicyclus anynana]
MGALASMFGRKDPRTPVKNGFQRLKNILAVHCRGIIGTLVPLIVLPVLIKKGEHHRTVAGLWFWMAWFFLWQPVNIEVTGFIPLFLLPMTGAMNTLTTTKCYFSDNVALLILGSMMHLLINSTGVDRRVILWMLCSGDSCQFSGKRLVFKASAAAFFLSMFCNRLIVTSTIIQLLVPAFNNLQSSTSGYRATKADYDVMRHIVICAVQTASSIGSVAIVHASFATMAMRAIFYRYVLRTYSNILPANSHWNRYEFPDVFNYLQYTCFAFPTAFVMFIFNFLYYVFLMNFIVKPMSGNSMVYMRNMLHEHKKSPSMTVPLTLHQKEEKNVCLFRTNLMTKYSDIKTSYYHKTRIHICLGFALNFLFCTILLFLLTSLKKCYYDFSIRDATVAAIFVTLLHIFPRTFLFTNYVTARVKSHIGPVLKPDSPFMQWNYFDKNTNYGYIILIGYRVIILSFFFITESIAGGGVALNTAIRVSKLNEKIPQYGEDIANLPWVYSILVVCIIATVLPNIMSSVAACCVLLPCVLHMAPELRAALRQDEVAPAPATPPGPWSYSYYLGALAVSMGSSFGFALPFLYTPAYFCHHTGKVPINKMIKYTIGSVFICIIVLWFTVHFFAPVIWYDKGVGIKTYLVSTTTTTTEAPPQD